MKGCKSNLYEQTMKCEEVRAESQNRVINKNRLSFRGIK